MLFCFASHILVESHVALNFFVLKVCQAHFGIIFHVHLRIIVIGNL